MNPVYTLKRCRMKPDQIVGTNRSVEQELLLCLVGPGASEAISGRVSSLLQQPLAWDYLLALAQQHRVTPVLHDHLEAYSEAVPEGTWAELKKRRRRISRTNFGLTSKLLKLLALLREHDIPVISYKGPALAQAAYGDIGRRQFFDLDIMVHKRDVPRVKEVLLANDCQPAWRLTAAQEAAVSRYYYEYPFLCNDGRVLVEVHWDFAEPFFSFTFDFDQLWHRLETVTILGREVTTLSPEDSLLVLCAHGSKHCWERLGWVCDVAQLISRCEDLNWELLVERATALGLLRMLWVGLQLASDLVGLELPVAVAQKMCAQHRMAEVTGQMSRGMFASFASEDKRSGTVEMTRLQLKLRERLKDRLNYCFRLLVMTKLVDSLFMPMGRPR